MNHERKINGLNQQEHDEIRNASEQLRNNLVWSDATETEIRNVFATANKWRELHELPMKRIRHQLLGYMRSTGVRGLTAARLKRMQSIRKKLSRRKDFSLEMLQDLAGCRVILPAMKDVKLFLSRYKDNHGHTLINEDDYISKPKRDGYRSHHMILAFCGVVGEDAHFGKRVEVQIRTRLQHAWATAVEGVGLFRGEDFKGGSGDADWRKLFELVSSEFAYIENCPLRSGSVSRTIRLAAIKQLDRKLNATGMLETMSIVSNHADRYMTSLEKPERWILTFDPKTKNVSVEGFNNARAGSASYNEAETRDARGSDQLNTVMVEVDKYEKLKLAYPNYFGDVQLFKKNLIKIVKGKLASEYTLPPQQTVPRPPKPVPDDLWLRRPQRRRWS